MHYKRNGYRAVVGIAVEDHHRTTEEYLGYS
jgi:hypothetical protein